MEFEFKRVFGVYSIQCSMGHEIVGRWLQEEIGRDQEKLQQVFELISEAETNKSQVLSLRGTEISLSIEASEVTVQENVLSQDSEQEFEPDMSFYNSESSAICGLEDFSTLIHQWQRFLTTGR
ncbi:hypothetical protein A9264_00405 [Vibrio sp. UCD-FRSSP16_10]|uniref:UPF0231 family protein n=1 Tax=unclassified Vibrio TaxID=2614977 RepID=UPI000801BAC1|nr:MULTISPECIES: YacL family protein [unclassified Vibrio]OBT17278.1 hypothetical protein A9260_01855 [Vibrio sp. UCD-FRSSP16_30]OBT23047.1 hypothetical protein A9264_00405 [Vibrio sp. UCD-FRSSP16_10]